MPEKKKVFRRLSNSVLKISVLVISAFLRSNSCRQRKKNFPLPLKGHWKYRPLFYDWTFRLTKAKSLISFFFFPFIAFSNSSGKKERAEVGFKFIWFWLTSFSVKAFFPKLLCTELIDPDEIAPGTFCFEPDRGIKSSLGLSQDLPKMRMSALYIIL